MKCSRCEGVIQDAWISIQITSSFGSSQVNWCFPCSALAMGRPVRVKMIDAVMRDGWFQQPLPLFAPRPSDTHRN